jgi:leader peptidase (prepilin peptidase)/N-methyltransferase
MIIVTVSDLYYKIVPDNILLIFLPVIFGLRMFSPEMLWWHSILGGVIGFGFMYVVALYGRIRFKKEALGGGDIKLYFLIGLFLGVNTVILSVLFAALLGIFYSLIFHKRKGYLPFVPFIFGGSLIAYFVGAQFIDWYVSLIF